MQNPESVPATKHEALKVNTIYRSIHQKFLQAIDHMEFHPTLVS